MPGEEAVKQEDSQALARALEALANPVRLALLHRLGQAGFMPDLAREFGMTRQALKKHLDALEEVGLIVGTASRRGALRATSYRASPAGLFAFKEEIRGLAVTTDPASLPPSRTMPAGRDSPATVAGGPGLLLVHGDVPGRWFPLAGRSAWLLGRDAKAEVALPYDPFASTRHAMLRLGSTGWTLTDLHSTNGTRVNFRHLRAGESVPVRPGDLLTVGRTHLLLREGV